MHLYIILNITCLLLMPIFEIISENEVLRRQFEKKSGVRNKTRVIFFVLSNSRWFFHKIIKQFKCYKTQLKLVFPWSTFTKPNVFPKWVEYWN